MNSQEKNKPVIEDIVLSSEQIQELDRVLKSKVSTKSKSYHIRAIIGGTCSGCFTAIPTKKAVYNLDDIKLVDYMCSECFDKAKKDLNKRLENMNFT